MTNRISGHLVWSLVASLLLTVRAMAQFETATVLGTVRDQAGAVVADTPVTLRNLATEFTQNVRTNTNGDFQFLNVPIGRYVVNVEARGFRAANSTGICADGQRSSTRGLRAPPGDPRNSRRGYLRGRLVETDSSSRGQVVTTKQIVELPLNGRAYSQLVYLAPGAHP